MSTIDERTPPRDPATDRLDDTIGKMVSRVRHDAMKRTFIVVGDHEPELDRSRFTYFRPSTNLRWCICPGEGA